MRLKPRCVMLPVVGPLDYNDDTRRRFVVRRYALDPLRRERRHVVIAVVDNRREFERLCQRYSDDLQRQRAAGEDVDLREHITGHVMEPGHLARARNGHLLRRAVEHGVWPAALDSLDLPGNMAVARVDEQQ